MANLLGKSCYHCGGSLPKKMINPIKISINGENKQLCCHGCQAVISVFLDKQLEANQELENPKKKCFFFLGYAFVLMGISFSSWVFV